MDEPTETSDNSLHTAATSPLLRDLWVRAFGPDLPADVQPTSSCSWWTLGYAVSRLRLAPDDLLVDLGCGRAGPGLWLARALRTRLIGIDLSQQAITQAVLRTSAFVSEDRAEFRLASFEETGLADASADGLVSVDALPFSEDLPAALREAVRVLRPGGRLVLSAWESDLPDDTGVPSWPVVLAEAGFVVEDSSPHPGCTERWLALYALLLDHEAELREQVNGEAVDRLIAEATDRPRRMAHRRNLLLTARRPV